MTNHNKLLSWSEGCIGLKTGYTKAAGRTLVSCMEKNGQRLVAVTLQDGNDWADHQALYEYGFSIYPARRLAVLGQPLRRVSRKRWLWWRRRTFPGPQRRMRGSKHTWNSLIP